MAAKRESIHIGDFTYFNAPLVSSDFIEIDINSQKIMEKCDISHHGVPAMTTGRNSNTVS